MNGEEAYFLSRAYTDKNSVDPTNYYDKTTTDTLLASKADASDTYTKTETDNLLKNKVDWESNGVLGAKNQFALAYNLGTTGVSTANDEMTNTLTDGSTTFDLQVRALKSGVDDFLIGKSISSAGYYELNVTIPSGYTSLLFKHNGASQDLGITIPIVEAGDWVLSFNVVGYNPSVVGGLEITEIMLCLATDTDSTYQPYAMTNRELTERVDKGSVSVVADGVKTVGTLFDDLITMANINRLSESSYVMLDRDCYRWQYTGSTLNIPFTQVYVEVDKLYVNTLRYTTGGSAWYLYTSTNGIQDNTTSVLTSGVTISLHY